MGGVVTGRNRVTLALLGTLGLLTLFVTPRAARSQDQPFIRGDANQDGVVSLADYVLIRRWALSYHPDYLPCINAADAFDDGVVTLVSMEILLQHLFKFNATQQTPLAAPFPDPGPDPTPNKPSDYITVDCQSYHITPPVESLDSVRLGEVQGAPGQEIDIPIYLTASVPVTALQMVIHYDPNLLSINPSRTKFTFNGTYFEQFIGHSYDYYDDRGNWTGDEVYEGPGAIGAIYPEQGIFTLGITSHWFRDGFEPPPGQDILFGRFHATVSPDAPPNTQIALVPTNGASGEGFGIYHMKNEITSKGEANYLTILPQSIPGKVGVVGDITFFFKRGDANGDKQVDISDVVSVIDYLYLGGGLTGNPDAADADDNGVIELTDAVVIINQLFLGTSTIASPFPGEGVDPTPDSIH